MSDFIEITPQDISGNPFDLIGKKWMLITAGSESGYNTMTASYGGMGILWGNPVTFCFIREQRYTFEFMQKEQIYSLSFYDEKYREALSYCGANSGRDGDKAKACGLTPVFDNGTSYFKEARLVLICKKLYVEQFKPELFLSDEIDKMYPDKDYHYTFIGKVTKVLKNPASAL